ncbi:hypothetical protein ACW9HM_05115 [Nocardia gipuzkoensis]
MQNVVRGSDALLAAYQAEKATIDKELIEELASRIGDIELRNILVKGTPVPDFLHATFPVRGAEKAGSMTGELLAVLAGRKVIPGTVRVFPRGIPWPDEFTIDITIAERQH